jgi:hypothetical protein
VNWPVTLEFKIRKWRWIGHTLRNGDESIGLESAGSQKGRKTEANLEKGRFGVKKKSRQNMEWG